MDVQPNAVEYHVGTDSGLRLVGLMGLSIFAFFVALVLLFVFAALDWLESDIGVGLSVGLVIGLPIATFYLLRHKTRVPAVVRLSADHVEIQRGSKTSTFRNQDIKSYETFMEKVGDEDFDSEGIIIRPHVGNPIRIASSTWGGSIKDMTAFRVEFEKWAEAQQLTRWEPWYRRKWRK